MSGVSPTLIKSFNAGAAVRGRRFVVAGAADGAVIEATGVAGTILGVSSAYDTAIGDQVDVTMLGTEEVILGGAVTRGARLTSDANGAAVAAAPAAGVNNSIGAIALVSGVAGDVIPVFVQQFSLQG
jgi:hypothetical protein